MIVVVKVNGKICGWLGVGGRKTREVDGLDDDSFLNFRSAWLRALAVAVISDIYFRSGVVDQSPMLPELMFNVLGEVNTI